jgi:NAD+ synthase (glutamine-hydrolysing)
MKELTIIVAQVNPLVGDLLGNTQLVLDTVARCSDTLAPTIVVFPELTLTAYPPEDLLLRPSLELRVEKALGRLCRELPPQIYVLLGYPRMTEAGLCNTAAVLHGGRIIVEYAKQLLPNYKVFDEKRYFVAGDVSCVIDIAGIPVALTVCEDIWHPRPTLEAKALGAHLMLNINASPFHIGKPQRRVDMIRRRVVEGGMPIVYVNQVGGQDELVFDGGSFAVDRSGELCFQAPHYSSGEFRLQLQYDLDSGHCRLCQAHVEPPLDPLASVYEALVLGVRDYVNKNGFKGVVLGLSGGIDSGLTVAVAVDALGPERVSAVMMPFRYTSRMSRDDAAEQAQCLGIHFMSMAIEPMFDAFMATLSDAFAGTERDTTEENLQARCRGVLLMALSNKKGYLVLTTGNKSEMAVGYSTLYGDMAGGYDVLKDVPKTLVFELARYRNTRSQVIPQRVIERPPSAELAPDQKDEDSLPPYPILDAILEHYVEDDLSALAIIERGYDAETVQRVLRLVDVNEYKRRQAPPGVRITERGFGRDRRYPMTSGWHIGD